MSRWAHTPAASHKAEAASLPRGAPPAGAAVAVDLSQCRYTIVHRVVECDMEWHVARIASRDDSTSQEKAPISKIPLLIWSDLSVTATRIVALRHAVAQSSWVSCVLINHIPGMAELCRKVPMATHLGRMRQYLPDAYAFVPVSWSSYKEYAAWAAAGADRHAVPCIVKPSSGCMGRGIILSPRAHPRLWTDHPNCVVQRYINNPLLIDGRKFDLRCYVFVASVDPWRVYFANDGLMRICALPFEYPVAEKESSLAVAAHLCNFAINGEGTAASLPVAAPRAGAVRHLASASASCQRSGRPGAKEKFSTFNTLLYAVCEEDECVARGIVPPFDDDHAAQVGLNAAAPDDVSCRMCCGYHARVAALRMKYQMAVAALDPHLRATIGSAAKARVEAVWQSIRLVALKALLGVLPEIEEAASLVNVQRGTSVVRCFELLGYDILLDDALQPWLIEVNHSPSWAVSNADDAAIKRNVLRGVMHALSADLHRRLPPASYGSMRLSGASNSTVATSDPQPREHQQRATNRTRLSKLRAALDLAPAEFHGVLAAREEEALGCDFDRLFPPPEWTGILDDTGPDAIRQQHRLSPAPATELYASKDKQCDSVRTEWLDAVDVYRQQRRFSRLRRGLPSSI